MFKPGIPPTARAAGVVSAVALLALASACSSGKSSSSAPAPAPTTATSPGMSGTTGTAGTSGTTVNSGSATVNGAQTAVLTAPDGHTLYYFTPDTAAGKPTCTGSCASLWPGLMSAHPTAATTATGTLSVVNGQVAYNGHPLYEYNGDNAAGQANGEGIMGKWYVATPTLATGASTPAPMTSGPSTSGGGSGGNY